MKKASHHEDKTLKTFFLYTILVLFLLGIALSVKIFFIIKASKFDGQHHFTVVFIQHDKVKEIMGFTPASSSVAILQINSNLPASHLGKNLEIIPDATVLSNSPFPEGQDPSSTMTTLVWRYSAVKTNLTLFDALRLMLLSKNASNNNITFKKVSLPQNTDNLDTLTASLFTDDVISQENVTIQVVNATDIGGFGQRLERMLVNMGANVVAVSTSPKKESVSTIQYYGNESYTLDKITRLLTFPTKKLDKQPIANIVITLGEDAVDTKEF